MTTPSSSERQAGAADASISAAPSPTARRSVLSAAVYSLGFTVQRAIGLLLLPVYTSVLTPQDYGTLGLLLAGYVGLTLVFSAGLDTSIVRSYFQLAARPDERQEYLDSVWRFLVWFPLCGAAVLIAACWPWVSSAHGRITPTELGLTVAAAASNAAATTLPLAVLRARQDLRGYVSMTAVLAVGTTGLTLIFVVGFKQGVVGWFLATLIGNLLLLATALVVVPWHARGRISWRVVGAALAFSLPLIPHFISHWALQLADRGVISGMVSASQLGVYTLAANLAGVVMMLVMALNQAFSPTYARAGAIDGTAGELSNVVVMQTAAVVGISVGAALLGPPVLELVTGPAYSGAAPLVPWLVVGYAFLGLYFIPMNGATLGAGRRTYAWVSTASCAAVNLALLFAFVPTYGIRWAAIASAIGYFVLLVSLSTWAHWGANPVSYDWSRLVPVVAAGLGVYAVSRATAPADPLARLFVAGGWYLVFVASAAVGGFRSTIALRLRRNELV